jgi:AcrR family transcriptional regulator
MDLAPASIEESAQTRIVDATLRCVARWGLSKTTVDDVAREAGVGRATLYRLFPGGRDSVLDAVLATELGRFEARVASLAAGADSLEDLVVAGVCDAATSLQDHAALQFLLAHEPETILPWLAFQKMDGILGVIGSIVGPLLAPWLAADGDPEAAPRGAEWIARIVLSYLCAPSADVDFSDAGSVRRLVRTYILPGLVPTNQQGVNPHVHA